MLLQTYTETDSVTRESEFNLDHVPLTVKVARPRKLEEEARFVTFIIFFLFVYLHQQFLFNGLGSRVLVYIDKKKQLRVMLVTIIFLLFQAHVFPSSNRRVSWSNDIIR